MFVRVFAQVTDFGDVKLPPIIGKGFYCNDRDSILMATTIVMVGMRTDTMGGYSIAMKN